LSPDPASNVAFDAPREGLATNRFRVMTSEQGSPSLNQTLLKRFLKVVRAGTAIAV
jgi:hypothetical protein